MGATRDGSTTKRAERSGGARKKNEVALFASADRRKQYALQRGSADRGGGVLSNSMVLVVVVS